MRVFRLDQDQVIVNLEPHAREILAMLPTLLEAVRIDEPASRRLDYSAHPDDSEADGSFRELIGDDLDDARTADRRSFTDSISRPAISLEQAEAWMRVVGEARLVLAARVGVTDDEWERSADPSDPQTALLGYLGVVQDALVEALTGAL